MVGPSLMPVYHPLYKFLLGLEIINVSRRKKKLNLTIDLITKLQPAKSRWDNESVLEVRYVCEAVHGQLLYS